MLDIVAVEDDNLNRMVLQKLFKYFGYTYKIYEHSDVFLKEYKNNSATIILMDIRLPIYNGNQLVQMLRARGDTTPIIASSADVMEEQCYQKNGYVDFILKPYDIDNMKTRIERYWRRS